MLEVVKAYTRARPHNGLRRFIPALRRVNAPLRWSLYGDDYSITR